jgi:hypothetical protein
VEHWGVAEASTSGDGRYVTSTMAVPGVLCLVGGLMSAGGSFLDWFGATSVGVAAVSVSGTEVWEGKLASACGAAAVIAVALTLRGRLRSGAGSAVAIAMLGLAVVAVAVFAAATARRGLVDAAAGRVAASAGVDEGRARDVVERAFNLHDVSVSVEAGIFVVLGGGALVSAAGIIPWLSSRAPAPSMPAAPRGAYRDADDPDA